MRSCHGIGYKARGIVAALTLGLVTLAACAENRALLVGVSEYPELGPEKQLKGPRNDVPMFRSILMRRGFASTGITLLADGVPGAQLPTRSNILAAANALAAGARSGDTIVIYLAGHGSQMVTDAKVPAQFRRSAGRQMMFMPRDVSAWDRDIGRVPNAIVDYEMTEIVDRIRARGAFVWAIVDACHSASYVRGVEDASAGRNRFLGPESLGAPALPADPGGLDHEADGMIEEASPGRVRGATAPTDAVSGSGGYVAFYAAESHEATEEVELPSGSGDRQWHGLFSYWLAAALERQGEASYRELGRRIRSAYAAENRRIPTPVFTGTDLDERVLGAASESFKREWPVRKVGQHFVVDAGILAQVAVGSILSVIPQPLTEPNLASGDIRVTRADLLQAEAVASDSNASAAEMSVPAGAIARLSAPALDLNLRVAVTPFAADAEGQAALAVFDQLRQALPANLHVKWVPVGEPADLRIVAEKEWIWLLSPGERWVRQGPDATPALHATAPDAAKQLASSLLQVSKVLNLLRISTALTGTELPGRLDVIVERVRKGKVEALDTSSVTDVHDGDQIVVKARNRDPLVAVDLTALYIDSRFQIQAIFPRGASGRLPAISNSEGEGWQTFSFHINDLTAGLERLLLISVRAVSGAEPHDFSYLQQEGLDHTRGARDSITELLEEAGFPAQAAAATRGVAQAASQEARIDTYSFRVQAPVRTAPSRPAR